jgi:LmbE family N-acetylglucosaminyl deacetylase
MDARKPLRVVAISPHSDDVALSVTHSLDAIARTGAARIELVTCFSRSEYTPFSERFPVSEVEEIRRQEDIAYLERLRFAQTSICFLGLLDAPLRPEWKHGSDIHDPAHYQPVYDAELESHASALAALLAGKRAEETVFFVPLGLAHKDHAITHRAALMSLASSPLLIYEDTPYLFQCSDAKLRHSVSAAQDALADVLSPIRIASRAVGSRWLECVSVYESQFSVPQLQEIVAGIGARGGERLWANASALSLLESAGVKSQSQNSSAPS